ncbi:MAG: hypothetical protein IT428_27080 [Planctomycetaceae bacterium]|nr:hypothetical protein [Planctomycetaceae bacterium]
MPVVNAALPPGTIELRIIVERLAKTGRWSAWFQDEPAAALEGDEAMVVFDTLVAARRDRLPDPYQLRVDDRRSRGGHIEVLMTGKRRERLPCPTCKGSGKYVGLSIVEPCSTCEGTGIVTS